MEELVRILIVTQHTNVTVQRDTQEPIVKRVRNYAITIHFKAVITTNDVNVSSSPEVCA